GFNVAFSNVRLRVTEITGDFFDVTVNGTQNVAATTTSATLNENMTVALAARNGSESVSGTLSQNWTAQFTCAQGQTFTPHADLPSGSLSVNGSSTWTGAQSNLAFTLSTASALVHNAACLADPRFDSGVIHAALAGTSGTIFIRIDFIGCGQDPV